MDFDIVDVQLDARSLIGVELHHVGVSNAVCDNLLLNTL